MNASTMNSTMKLQTTTLAVAVFSTLSLGVIDKSWAQDGSPDIYFGDGPFPTTTDIKDRDQKQRCVDDETVVYFSNGVANEWSHALEARTKLQSNLDDYLDSTGQRGTFGKFTTANAFTNTSSEDFGFINDIFRRVFPDSHRLDYVQNFRRKAGLVNNPAAIRKLIRKAILEEHNLLDKSVAAGPHAKGYDAMLEKGRGNVVVGHSYGTILANASYFGVPEYNRPGHVIVQTALVDNEISGADRFSGDPPYTTINEDVIASGTDSYGDKENGNVNNYPGALLAPGGMGHNFVKHYMGRIGYSAPHPANEKIMNDIVRMQAELEPRPCHGFILGGAAINQNPQSGELSATQLSYNGVGRYVDHPSKAPPTVPPAPDGPTKLVDWRGQFVSGEATRVVSIAGPAARYNGPALFSNTVYRWGEEAYRAPGSVLGAAIQKNANGEEWIVVAGHNKIPVRDASTVGDTVTIWRRSAALFDLDASVYDRTAKPDGWQRVTCLRT